MVKEVKTLDARRHKEKRVLLSTHQLDTKALDSLYGQIQSRVSLVEPGQFSLVAHYYAFCAEHDHLEAFGGIAYLPNITGLAGQILGMWQLGADTIRRAANRSLADNNGRQPDCLFVSNLMALAAWNPHSILEGEAWSASVDVFTEATRWIFTLPNHECHYDSLASVARRTLRVKALFLIIAPAPPRRRGTLAIMINIIDDGLRLHRLDVGQAVAHPPSGHRRTSQLSAASPMRHCRTEQQVAVS